MRLDSQGIGRIARSSGAVGAATALLALAQLGGPLAHDAVAAVPRACPKVLAIGVRGSGDTSTDAAGLGTTISVAVKRFRQIIGRDTRVLAVDYPSFGIDLGLTNPGRFYDGVRTGVETLVQIVEAQQASCPRTTIAVFGYSQGAMVVNRALIDLGAKDPRLLRRIAATELIADPQRLGRSSYVRGSASQRYDGLGVHAARLAVLGIGFPAGDLPADIQERSRSYCVAGDVVCAWDTSDALAELATSGTFAAVAHAHNGYVTNGYARRAGTNAAHAVRHFESKKR